MDFRLLSRMPIVLSFALLAVVTVPVSVFAADPLPEEEAGPLLNEEEMSALGEEPAAAVSPLQPATVFTGAMNLGYLSLHRNDAGRRAFPYAYLHPGAVGGGSLTMLHKNLNLDLAGNYLSGRDNNGSLTVDFGGHYRFFYLSDVLFHNLQAKRYAWSGPLTISNGNSIDYDPSPATGEQYGLKVRQDQVRLSAKPFEYPFHLDLGFRRFDRQGTTQLRFSDVHFASPTNVVYNRSRRIDQTIYEGTAGLDAHLGYIDLVNQFQIRHFVDNAGIPRMVSFLPQQNATTTFRTGGLLQHNENPDSRFWSNTLRLHSSISGGLVGAVSYTFGQRLSFSRLTDVAGANDTQTTVRNMAADLTYTPLPELTASIKYRRQTKDNKYPAALIRLPGGGAPAGPEELTMQQQVDSRLDSIIGTMVYRPLHWLLLKGEFKGDFMKREGDGDGAIAPWVTKHHEDRYQGRGTFIVTPVKGMRIKGQYTYSAMTHPFVLYGTSYDERHVGDLVATYSRANAFGASFSYRDLRDHVSSGYRFDRTDQAVTTAWWVQPLTWLTLNASIAYQRSATDRLIRYGISPPTATPTVTYESGNGKYTAQSHIYGAGALVRLQEKAELTVAYQQVRGSSVFDPEQQTINVNSNIVPALLGSTAGIADINRTREVAHELTSRLDYHVSEHALTSFEYMYRSIRDRVDSSLNGSAHLIMASFGVKW